MKTKERIKLLVFLVLVIFSILVVVRDLTSEIVVVDVTDYGALADNSTDIRPGVLRAFKAAKEFDPQRPIYFPPGKYKIWGDMPVDWSNAKVFGGGMNLTFIRQMQDGANGFSNPNITAKKWHISDLSLLVARGVVAGNGIDMLNVSDSTIDRVTIWSGSDWGWTKGINLEGVRQNGASGPWRNKIFNSRIRALEIGIHSHGDFFSWGANSLRVRDCVVQVYPIGTKILVEQGGLMVFDGNTLESPGGDGIVITGGHTIKMTANRFEGSRIGIWLGAGLVRSTVLGNFYNCTLRDLIVDCDRTKNFIFDELMP